VVQPIFCYFVFTRVDAVGWRDIARIYVPPIVFGAATVGGASLLSMSLHAPPWLQLCLVPTAALAMYVPIIRAVCPRPYRLLRDRALSFRTRSVAS
jgi:hypothetical protein